MHPMICLRPQRFAAVITHLHRLSFIYLSLAALLNAETTFSHNVSCKDVNEAGAILVVKGEFSSGFLYDCEYSFTPKCLLRANKLHWLV